MGRTAALASSAVARRDETVFMKPPKSLPMPAAAGDIASNSQYLFIAMTFGPIGHPSLGLEKFAWRAKA
ncbi:hypothetical protein [Novosphingobium kaempferiae]|uniref:hypothetical protein n=1 Tax=Novosphingobium kaempferiae TaxID=2896849 RepID=UPI001E61D727|nr:hypothetical protein [Novosphingobium kaempferiae]